jgi:Fe-S cluster biogenesis protein NfuA
MSTAAPARVDRDALLARIDQVCAAIGAHAGAIELLETSEAGVVRVRFTGMCTGCLFRPLTMMGTVEPALLQVPGVTAVEAAGTRISDEAAARMRHYLGDAGPPPLPAVQSSP